MPDRQSGRSPILIGVLVAIAVVAYAADQLSKSWVVANLQLGVREPLLGELLQMRRTSNPGAAFSLATNATWVLTTIACVVIVVIIFIARKLRSRGWAAALGLLVGGALGNLTDRFVREPGGGHGHVVDFLQFPHFPFIDFPIFNVADICITSAAVLICILAFLGIGVDGTRVGDDEDEDEDEEDDEEADGDRR
ncbi:signal peptidase II [Dermacoccaceae bacterium W4C1]